ncbi:ATP-dependent DNA helicase PIF1-like isoform 1-T1 [Syngnathus typhle]
MVSKDLFAYVNARLKQIKGINLPFGGMSVLAVGDFFQLPPVRQSKPLCVYDPTRLDHWRDDFKKITLTAIMRQKDDVAFAELLNRLRVKEKSDELSEMDRALLATRTLCRLTRMTTRKTKELAEWQGLCNGMFAKVVKLVNYPNEARVQKLGLELDHVSNTARAANPVYIDRLEEKLNKAGVTRRQFPIKLAFACTIHKVQGMTTSQAAVSLKGVFEHGMGDTKKESDLAKARAALDSEARERERLQVKLSKLKIDFDELEAS